MSNVRLREDDVQAPLGVVDQLLQAIQVLKDSQKQLQDQVSKLSARDQSVHRPEVDHLPSTLPTPHTTPTIEGMWNDETSLEPVPKEALAKHL